MNSLISIILALIIQIIGVGIPKLQQESNCISAQQIGTTIIHESHEKTLIDIDGTQQEIKST